MSDPKLRPAQQDVLQYTHGHMGVSAVPGSGKTFTLSTLAAKLIAQGHIDPQAGQQILIVTYLNSSAENFKTRLRDKLLAQGLQPVGYDARTLHSMALEIIKLMHGDALNMPTVVDDGQSGNFLSRAIDLWREQYPEQWEALLPEDTPRMRVRWRNMIERTSKVFIRTAKNQRFTPQAILERLGEQENSADWQFSHMFAGIYERYQLILQRQGALDYDDQIWEAVEHVEGNPQLLKTLRHRWPYILEDEAQDSVPLQEELLQLLTGKHGNLVRVGDPNQAITTTFTSAEPRFFIDFLKQNHVTALPLPNSGRNAPVIFSLANRLVDWVCEKHPVADVRTNTFRQQHIQPTPAGDAQPNPRDPESNIVIREFDHRERAEIPNVINLADYYVKKFPDRTVAILVPTNNVGHTVIERLDAREIKHYDSLLRGGLRERQVAGALHALLALLANPLYKRNLRQAFDALRDMGHRAASDELEDMDRFNALLSSVHRIESLLYPANYDEMIRTLPRGIATPEDIAQLEKFTRFLRRIFDLRPLTIDALAMALGDELFLQSEEIVESDLAIAYQLATILQNWQDMEPEKRLPDLVAELGDVATGRRRLNLSEQADEGFEPKAGRITLATQHSAKGLEFDAVFMIGIDGFWVPNNLDAYFQGVYNFVGGDPTAQAKAELLLLMRGESADRFDDEMTPTDAAHIEVISERLRLLYVGITRAKRFLQISHSRMTAGRGQDRDSTPTEVLDVLRQFLAHYKRNNQVGTKR